jgi:hypothetical protein
MKHFLNRNFLAAFSIASALLATHASAATYSIDSGSVSLGIGGEVVPGTPWSGAVLNHFTAVAGSQIITSISVVFGYPADPGLSPSGLVAGDPFTVGIWSDPNNDGNPNDAVLLGSTNGTISIFNNSTFQTTPLSVVLGVGQSFFAGVMVQNYGDKYPMGVSMGNSPTESWGALVVGGTLNPNNLAGANILAPLQNFPNLTGIPAVGLVRANGVPEPTSTCLTAVAGIALLRRRRRAFSL